MVKLWQSFDYPTNNMLPLMKFGLNWRTGLNQYLTSWKSKDDIGTGNYSFRLDPSGYPQFFFYMDRVPLWRIGSWSGQGLSGTLQFLTWSESRWVGISSHIESCNKYLFCGPNGYCDPYNVISLSARAYLGSNPSCPMIGFVKLARMKVPDTSKALVDMSISLEECEQECLRNCSCTAYSSTHESEGIGCLRWHGELVDTRTFSDARQDLYIHVDAVVLAQYAKKNGLTWKKRTWAIIGVSVAVMLLLVVSIVYWLIIRTKRGKRQSTYSYTVASNLPYFEDSPSRKELDGTRNSNFPIFDLETIIAATDNFSDANKLGKGGFGIVYKMKPKGHG
nr:g-type lectin s-receptor-like serine/threonine-protein kinase rks1 [Quercus suber]